MVIASFYFGLINTLLFNCIIDVAAFGLNNHNFNRLCLFTLWYFLGFNNTMWNIMFGYLVYSMICTKDVYNSVTLATNFLVNCWNNFDINKLKINNSIDKYSLIIITLFTALVNKVLKVIRNIKFVMFGFLTSEFVAICDEKLLQYSNTLCGFIFELTNIVQSYFTKSKPIINNNNGNRNLDLDLDLHINENTHLDIAEFEKQIKDFENKLENISDEQAESMIKTMHDNINNDLATFDTDEFKKLNGFDKMVGLIDDLKKID